MGKVKPECPFFLYRILVWFFYPYFRELIYDII